MTNRHRISVRRQHRNRLAGAGRFLLSNPVNSGKVRKVCSWIIADSGACCLSAVSKNRLFAQHFNFDQFQIPFSVIDRPRRQWPTNLRNPIHQFLLMTPLVWCSFPAAEQRIRAVEQIHHRSPDNAEIAWVKTRNPVIRHPAKATAALTNQRALNRAIRPRMTTNWSIKRSNRFDNWLQRFLSWRERTVRCRISTRGF